MNILMMLGYKELYFIIMNTSCIAILVYLWVQWSKQKRDISTGRKIMYSIISLAVVFCASDIVAGVLQDYSYKGSNIVLYVSNIIYYGAVIYISLFWALYAMLRVNIIGELKGKQLLMLLIPSFVFMALLLTTPLTHWIFYIDKETSAYSRGSLVFLHWVVCLFYIGVGSYVIIRAMNKSRSKVRKEELRPILYFPIAPILLLVVQIFTPSLTTTQFGITFSALLLFVEEQKTLVQTDDLTKVNNRRSLDGYIESVLSHANNPIVFSFLMIDINRFKEINDNYGHLMGDRVLKSFSEVLKIACESSPKRLFLCRYGGDEFVVVGKEVSEEDFQTIKDVIDFEVSSRIDIPELDMKITASVGMARGLCQDIDDAEHLMRVADEDMYEQKKIFRNNLKTK